MTFVFTFFIIIRRRAIIECALVYVEFERLDEKDIYINFFSHLNLWFVVAVFTQYQVVENFM